MENGIADHGHRDGDHLFVLADHSSWQVIRQALAEWARGEPEP